MIAFVTIFYCLLISTLLLIAIVDYATSEIPNILNALLGLLGVVYYFCNIRVNWWLPLVLSISSFIFFFVFFLLTKELAIGGGDMKMIIVSMLFVNSFTNLYYYLIFFSIFALVGVILTLAKKQKGVRCGPYLGLALIFMLFHKNMSFADGLTISLEFIVFTIAFSYFYLDAKGGMYFDEEIYQLY